MFLQFWKKMEVALGRGAHSGQKVVPERALLVAGGSLCDLYRQMALLYRQGALHAIRIRCLPINVSLTDHATFSFEILRHLCSTWCPFYFPEVARVSAIGRRIRIWALVIGHSLGSNSPPISLVATLSLRCHSRSPIQVLSHPQANHDLGSRIKCGKITPKSGLALKRK